jgi:transposase
MRIIREEEAEVVSVEAAAKRRFRSKQERRRIAEESLQPGASAAVVARRHEVNANQVFHWRKLLREGRLDEKRPSIPLLPVRISDMVDDQIRSARCQPGSIHVEVGRARVRVEGAADPESLRLILEHFGR